LVKGDQPFDLADIRGQETAKRTLEIAAAGFHNLFLHGTPGAGKTLLARTLPTILPALTENEALEVTKIYSISGHLPPHATLITARPFRSPHHTTSRTGLIGGGTQPAPGEISLAHRGVLFLDEFPEFARSHLEALRQPLEDGQVTISRAAGTIRFPSRFLLIAAANPCPCGYHGSAFKPCRCLPGQILRYQKRLSGPILDRIDLHVHCPAVPAHQLTNLQPGEPSKAVRTRVQAAQARQLRRFKKASIHSNGEMTSRQVKDFCPLDSQSTQLLETAVSRLHLSARSYFKIIKVARTIADLAGEENISSSHLAEALQYRPQESF
jgi:magnesium chelatase family protein